MSEARDAGERRRGRGLDAIFDSADLELDTAPADSAPQTGSPQPAETAPRSTTNLNQERGQERRGAYERRAGRPRSRRDLIQRGFYLEPAQDEALDRIRLDFKRSNFSPDRSAIVRAAIASFEQLDPVDQEDLIRRAK